MVAITNKKIFRAARLIAILSGLVVVASAVREVLIARYFGRSDAVDALMMAFLLPTFLSSLLAPSISLALIPIYTEVLQQKGKRAAQQLFANTIVVAIFVLSAFTLLAASCARVYLPLLASGFHGPKLTLAAKLLYLLLPYVVFNGLALIFAATLNLLEQFWIPALSPALIPASAVVLLLLDEGRNGVAPLAIGMLLGSLMEMLLLFELLRRRGMFADIGKFKVDPQLGSIFKQTGTVLAGSVLMCSTNIVDQSMAAMLGPGSVAALIFGKKTITAALAIISTAVTNAAFPYLAKMTGSHNWRECRHILRQISTWILVVTVPITVLLCAFSRPMIHLLFQRGSFTGGDTRLVARIQALYALQIPFYVAGMLFVRLISALKRNDLLLYGAGANLILDVLLNWLLMHRIGIAGIALSTSAVYVFSFAYLVPITYWVLRNKQNAIPSRPEPAMASSEELLLREQAL